MEPNSPEKNVSSTIVSSKTESNEPPREHFWRDTLKYAVIALAIVLPFRYFIAQPFVVSGASMDPTFANGQYLIVDEISYRIGSPNRGDVLIFKYPYDQSKDFIKRVIGLPGETVILHDKKVSIKNDRGTIVLLEPYISRATDDEMTVTLKSDQYFVMGDNRPESLDSRIWGPLPKKLIIGKPFVRLLPISSISLYPGAFNTSASTTQQ